MTKEFLLYFFLFAIYATLISYYFFSRKIKKELDFEKKTSLKKRENFIFMIIFFEAAMLLFFGLTIYGKGILVKMGIN